MSISLEVLTIGSLRCRPSMLSQPTNRSVFLRRLTVMTDMSWSEYIPVHVFLISHPEGYILFDTGLNTKSNNRGYFPAWMPTFKMTTQIKIDNEQGFGEQLRARGFQLDQNKDGETSGTKKLSKVIISHLHYDHAGNLSDIFHAAPIFTTKEHWDSEYNHFLHSLIDGALPEQWPKNWTPSFLIPSPTGLPQFTNSYPLTTDNKIIAVDTPGHDPGHISLIVYADEAIYFLTGDATYSLEALDREGTDGVNSHPKVALESVRRIKEFCKGTSCVVLPSHDRETVGMWREGRVYCPTDLGRGN